VSRGTSGEAVGRLVEEKVGVTAGIVTSAIQIVQGDPRSIHEAQARLDWSQWKTAMDKEIATLEQARTWINIERPPGKNIVGSKWVF